jgi:peptide/nickel transport system substrate-binding protein
MPCPTLRLIALCTLAWTAAPAQPNQLRIALRADPKTLDPMMVTEESGDTIRYLTQAPLIRLNRQTQLAEPALAVAWKVLDHGRALQFELRPGVRFATGEPFDSADVAYTFARLADKSSAVPAGEALRATTPLAAVETPTPLRAIIRFTVPVADPTGLFDELPLLSSRTAKPTGLGPFAIDSYEPGARLTLKRNPNYWKRDAQGRPLPYLSQIQISFQNNRDLELALFRRGEEDIINALDADNFERLRADGARQVIDAGPTFDAEMLWFNLSPKAPLPPFKREWFASPAFRQAISLALSREALVRLAYRGAAEPAFGPISPAARNWIHTGLDRSQVMANPTAALQRLQSAGFTLANHQLRDRIGNPVEFSLITNAGNKTRARLAQLIEQDLAAIGVKLNIVSLDMPSLVERLMKSGNYEACLLGLVGIDLDPADQANLWMSSSATHQWNPSQAKPGTAWEAEIDAQMRILTTESNTAKRKRAAWRLQEIAAAQQPLIYLVHPHALMAAQSGLAGTAPVALRPRLLWNAERLSLRDQSLQGELAGKH